MKKGILPLCVLLLLSGFYTSPQGQEAVGAEYTLNGISQEAAVSVQTAAPSLGEDAYEEWLNAFVARRGITHYPSWQAGIASLGYELAQLLDQEAYGGIDEITESYYGPGDYEWKPHVVGLRIYYLNNAQTVEAVLTPLLERYGGQGQVDIQLVAGDYSLKALNQACEFIKKQPFMYQDVSACAISHNRVCIDVRPGSTSVQEFLEDSSLREYVDWMPVR